MYQQLDVGIIDLKNNNQVDNITPPAGIEPASPGGRELAR